MIPSVRAVFFDLDNTLLDHSRAVRAALSAVYERYAELFEHLDLEELSAHWNAVNDALWEEHGAGRITSEELQLSRARQLIDWALERSEARVGSVPRAEELSAFHIDSYVAACRAYDGVIPMLDALRDRFMLGIITNSFVAAPKLERAGIDSYFRHVVLSGEVGVQKPDPRIFHVALERAGLAPHEMLYVGDNFALDVEGAARAGLGTIWFNPRDSHHQSNPQAAQPGAVARSVADLAALLGVGPDPSLIV